MQKKDGIMKHLNYWIVINSENVNDVSIFVEEKHAIDFSKTNNKYYVRKTEVAI